MNSELERIIETQEAGAKITDFQGNKEMDDKNSIFLAGNGTKLHAELLKIPPPL